jgi:integrase
MGMRSQTAKQEETDMPKTGSNIYKRKDGRWEGRYRRDRDGGGRIVYGYVYARKYAEAKEKLATAQTAASALTAQKWSVADTARLWLTAKTPRIKPSTLATYEAAIRLHILPQLGFVEVAKLTSASIGEYAQAKLRGGRVDGKGGLSPKTVRDILSVLKCIIDFAISERPIENTVAIALPKQQHNTPRVLSPTEQTALEGVLSDGTDIYKAGVLLCLYTGLRVGEVCGLGWRDFSPGFDKVSVHSTVRRIGYKGGVGKTRIEVGSPKSRASTRDVPIPKFLSPMLRRLANGGGLHFIQATGGRMAEPRTMQYHFKRFAKAAGLACANFHCLRHTFATRCVEAGVDAKSLSEMLGHATVSITMDRYVHSSFEQKRAGIDRLERYRSTGVLVA